MNLLTGSQQHVKVLCRCCIFKNAVAHHFSRIVVIVYFKELSIYKTFDLISHQQHYTTTEQGEGGWT